MSPVLIPIISTFVQISCKNDDDEAFLIAGPPSKELQLSQEAIMQSFVLQAATFLVVATAAVSQSPAAAMPTTESQKYEQQIRQLEDEMLKGEMNSDAAVVEKIFADDCVLWPAGPSLTKAKLADRIRKSQGHAPPYIATDEDMHVYVLGDTAVAIYVKKYAVRANPDHVDFQDLTDVFVRSAGTWKLKISRSSPHKNAES